MPMAVMLCAVWNAPGEDGAARSATAPVVYDNPGMCIRCVPGGGRSGGVAVLFVGVGVGVAVLFVGVGVGVAVLFVGVGVGGAGLEPVHLQVASEQLLAHGALSETTEHFS